MNPFLLSSIIPIIDTLLLKLDENPAKNSHIDVRNFILAKS
jgi:hypothetical protein